jgi:integrating conjugative element protein (TIGR03758 family)
MSAPQTSAFNSYGSGWLTPGAVDLFFASIFAAIALWILAAVVLDCYTAWQNNQLKIGEAGKVVLELTAIITFLLFIIR